jgi:hypothetical protein
MQDSLPTNIYWWKSAFILICPESSVTKLGSLCMSYLLHFNNEKPLVFMLAVILNGDLS